MNIAILGTGNVGRTLASGLVASGPNVQLGSRTPREHHGTSTAVVSHAEAVDRAELVVSAVAAVSALENAEALGATALAGKILLDLGNAVTPSLP